jgi:hypothetical protein
MTALRVFPHFVLVKPDRIGVPANKLVCIQSVNCERALYSLLLAIDKDDHGLALPALLCGLFGLGQFSFWFGHRLHPCVLLDRLTSQRWLYKTAREMNSLRTFLNLAACVAAVRRQEAQPSLMRLQRLAAQRKVCRDNHAVSCPAYIGHKAAAEEL